MAEHVTLQAEDGHSFDCYLAQPEGAARGGLVVIQEIFGVNSHIRSVADGYAADGFLVAAPALFDRIERGIELGYNAEDIARGRELKAQSGWDQAELDVTAAVQAASAAGKVGIVGYCWGGSVAFLAACRCPVAAAIGYYGGQILDLKTEKPDYSPQCPTMLHFGEKDAGIPLADVEAIGAAHPEIEIHRYDADHGFNCDQRGSYDAESARRARQRSLDFFLGHLT